MVHLDLVPDLSKLLIHTGVFSLNWFLAKKFYIDPFLELRAARAKATTDKLTEAQAISGRLDDLRSRCDSTLAEAAVEVRKQVDSIVREARGRAQKCLDTGRERSAEVLSQGRKELTSQLDLEATKLQSKVDPLVARFCDRVLAGAT